MLAIIKTSWKPVGVFLGALTLTVALGVALSAVGCGGREEGTASPVARNQAPAPEAVPAHTGTAPGEEPTTGAAVAGVDDPAGAGTSPMENEAREQAGSEDPGSFAEAKALLEEGRYDDAAEHFAVWTKEHPESAWGHTMLGLSLWKAGRWEDAEAAFHAAVERDPMHLEGRTNLARVLIDEGRFRDARVVAEQAAALDPRSADAQRVLGRAYQNLNRNEEAKAAYRRAVRLDPGDAWSMNNLGLLYLQGGQAEQALPPLARAVQVDGTVAVFRNNLGLALERTGHFRAAAGTYAAALDADPGHNRAAANLARVRLLDDLPGTEPVDLAALAGRFEQDMAQARAGLPGAGARAEVAQEVPSESSSQ